MCATSVLQTRSQERLADNVADSVEGITTGAIVPVQKNKTLRTHISGCGRLLVLIGIPEPTAGLSFVDTGPPSPTPAKAELAKSLQGQRERDPAVGTFVRSNCYTASVSNGFICLIVHWFSTDGLRVVLTQLARKLNHLVSPPGGVSTNNRITISL